MLLKKIALKNFRNFEDKIFDIGKYLTLVIGENAKGKTNLLESVYFLINGSGFRESREEEFINFDKNDASVEGIMDNDGQMFDFKITLIKKDGTVVKTFFVEKTKKRFIQYGADQTRAVLFSPEQIDIMIGSPDIRRDYLNRQISSYDYEYKKRLVNYENAIRRRNKVLESYRDEKALIEELIFWNQYLEEQGSYITKKRGEYIDFLNSDNKIDGKEFSIEYIKNELTQARLKGVYENEKRYRRTLIGPQKDDFQISEKEGEKNINLHHYGSRGEQRMAVFWLKLNEINYYKSLFNKKPILLLDDVFSEFDKKNKKLILHLIEEYQTIVTTTETELVDIPNKTKKVINL